MSVTLSNGVVAFPYVFETHKGNFKVDVVSVGALLGFSLWGLLLLWSVVYKGNFKVDVVSLGALLGFSLCWLLSLWSVVSRCTGFTRGGMGLRGCSSPAPACSVVWHADSAAHCTWGLPGPGMEPVSFELVGGFFATEPPRKPFFFRLLI